MVCSSEQLKNEFYRCEKGFLRSSDLNMSVAERFALRQMMFHRQSESLLSLTPNLPRYISPYFWNHPACFSESKSFDFPLSHNLSSPILRQFVKLSDHLPVPMFPHPIRTEAKSDEPLDLIVRSQSPQKYKSNSWTPDSGISSPPMGLKDSDKLCLDIFKSFQPLRSPPPLIAKPPTCSTLKDIPPLVPTHPPYPPSEPQCKSEDHSPVIDITTKSCPTSPHESLKRKSPHHVTQSAPQKKTKTGKRTKMVRRLNFDDSTVSPVSGTIIRKLEEGEELPKVVRRGDIDPAYNVVEVTEEAKAELAKIENKIGDYVCQLCKCQFDDAFGLAQHRCAMIVHVEYRCPDCDKLFNCPANLASHRRWHRPRTEKAGKSDERLAKAAPVEAEFECSVCYCKFPGEAALDDHVKSHIIGFKPSLAVHHAPIFHPPLTSNKAFHTSFKPTPHSPPRAEDPSDPSMFLSPTQLICHLCRHVFASKLSLQEHYHKGCQEDIYPCSSCCMVFYSPGGLTRHFNKDHSEEVRHRVSPK